MVAKLKKTKSAISQTVSRLRAKGAISGKPARGKPRISTSAEDQRLAKIIQVHWRKPLSWLSSKWGMKCSAKTFKRRIRDLIRWRIRKTPIQERHRTPRVQWARDHLNWSSIRR